MKSVASLLLLFVTFLTLKCDRMKVLLISVLVKNQHAEHMQKDLNNSLMKERSLVNSLKETLAKEKSRMTELGVALEKERVQALSLK